MTEEQEQLHKALALAAVETIGDTFVVRCTAKKSGDKYVYEFCGYKTEPAYFPCFERCEPIEQEQRVTHVELKVAEVRYGLCVQQFAVQFETDDLYAQKASSFMEVVRVSLI